MRRTPRTPSRVSALATATSVARSRARILLLPRGRRRTRLERWFAHGAERIACVAWDAETALRQAALLARLRQSGRAMPIKDSLIAASALRHDLVVVTRNRRDFAAAGVRMLDPFAGRQGSRGPARPTAAA